MTQPHTQWRKRSISRCRGKKNQYSDTPSARTTQSSLGRSLLLLVAASRLLGGTADLVWLAEHSCSVAVYAPSSSGSSSPCWVMSADVHFQLPQHYAPKLARSLLDLGGEAGADETVLGLEGLLRLLVVVNEAEALGDTAAELGAEAEDDDALLVSLVKLAKALAELDAREVGAGGVGDREQELLAVKQAVRDELGGPDGDGSVVGLRCVSTRSLVVVVDGRPPPRESDIPAEHIVSFPPNVESSAAQQPPPNLQILPLPSTTHILLSLARARCARAVVGCRRRRCWGRCRRRY